jgi:hypothetical protein
MIRAISASSPGYTNEAYGVRIYVVDCPLCGLQCEYRRGITKSCEHLVAFDYVSDNFIFNTEMSPSAPPPPRPPNDRQLSEPINSQTIKRICFAWGALAALAFALVVSIVLYVLRSLR